MEVCGEVAGTHALAGGGEENLSWKKGVFVCLVLAGAISAAQLQFSVTRHYVILVASMTTTLRSSSKRKINKTKTKTKTMGERQQIPILLSATGYGLFYLSPAHEFCPRTVHHGDRQFTMLQ